MAKRFTDTEKWDRPWFRKLPLHLKLLWLFILDRCDVAGVWYVDMEMADFLIGFSFKREETEKSFEKQIEVKGDRWLIKDFVSFQYGGMNPENKLYRNVSAKLSCFNNGAYMPHKCPINGAKDKDKDRDKEKVKEKGEGSGEGVKILTDVQKVVTVYKIASGYSKEDPAWDKLNFARCSKSAKQLLDFIGNWKDAGNCIQDVYEKLTAKGLTVTLETVAKHAADWKKDKQEKGVPIGVLS